VNGSDSGVRETGQTIFADLDRAEADARAALNAHPDNADAAILLARALRAKGDARTARKLLEPFIARDAGNAFAHYVLALCHCDLGESQNAIAGFQRAAGLDPNLPGVWLALADELFHTGDRAGADLAYMRHVEASANAAHIRAAASALSAGKPEDADQILQRHLDAWPNDVAVLAMQAETFARYGRELEAVPLFEQCLARAPSFSLARYNYATVLQRLGSFQAALAEADILLRHDAHNPDFRNLRVGLLTRLGNFELAIAYYENLLSDFPNDARTWTNLGNTLKGIGRQREAIAAFRKAIALSPDFGGAWSSIANLKTVAFSRDDVAAMQALVARDDLDSADRLDLHFALGKALEDEGRFAEAFDQYAKGNALKRQEIRYSVDETEARVTRAKAVLTPAFFAACSGSGAEAADPIFIVGLPRAGTTLVEQILASHSDVEGTMELPDILAIARRLGADGKWGESPAYPGVLATLAPSGMRKLGEEYLARTRAQRRLGKPFFIDKMPANFFHIFLIHLILPNAKIIDVRRRPMASGFALYKQLFGNGQRFSFDLGEIGRYYRAYFALMAHVDRVLPGRVHRVQYEALVADPESEIRALLAHCKLPFEASCLDFHTNARAVSTLSSEQVRRPIFTDAVEQWRNFEPWLGPLKAALGPLADA
jgi:tetratricopeptide (TPR) repeat protein